MSRLRELERIRITVNDHAHDIRPRRLPLRQRLIKRHGQDAPIQAAMRADELLEKGDLDGAAVWRRVLRAVEELQDTAPKSGEVVH